MDCVSNANSKPMGVVMLPNIDKKGFLSELRCLLKKYEVDIHANTAYSYDGEYVESISIDDKYGRQIMSVNRMYLDFDDVENEMNKL